MESIKTILYFSIFRYPLTIEEIHSYTNHKDLSETRSELDVLIAKEMITQVADFYVYGTDIDSVPKRIKGNIQAEKVMEIAKERAQFISKFPFVKAVGISGSLSKGYYDTDSDIDFFVITKHSKLWICRTVLMLYKKIFLLNSRKYFCINYFISENQLQIVEQNRFTATEIKTLIPLQGKSLFDEFFTANSWVNSYFSNFEPSTESIQIIKKPVPIRFIEFLLNNKIGHTIDSLFKWFTLKKWNAKFHYLSEKDFKISLKTTTNISKHHPSNFQKKVLLALNEKLEEAQEKLEIELAKEYV